MQRHERVNRNAGFHFRAKKDLAAAVGIQRPDEVIGMDGEVFEVDDADLDMASLGADFRF